MPGCKAANSNNQPLMGTPRSLLLLILFGGSGLVSYLVFSSKNPETGQTRTTTSRSSPRSDSSRPASDPARPLPLENPRLQEVDPTNHDVMVSDLALAPVGERVEKDSRARLQELTERYQLTANQRREAFPLLVRYHPEYRDGLIVNGTLTRAPADQDFSSQFANILDLSQRELFQEDLGADRAWWYEVLNQIRDNLERTAGRRTPPRD